MNTPFVQYIIRIIVSAITLNELQLAKPYYKYYW